MELAMELSQIATLRRVLEIFCARHELEFADRPAIIAARELMKFADEGETDPVILQRRLDEAMQTYGERMLPAQRAVASMGALPARHQ
jgi:sensor domain CHASE-containing protein